MLNVYSGVSMHKEKSARKLFRPYLTTHFTVSSQGTYFLIVLLCASSMIEMVRHTYWVYPYVLWLFSVSVLDPLLLIQALKVPANPDPLSLICQQNPRCAQKLPSGSYCSLVYLCLILAFIPHHSMLRVLPRNFKQMLSSVHHSLETKYPAIPEIMVLWLVFI